jgi:glycerate kinase
VNILIAPDKFKGTLTAMEVCDAIEHGLHRSMKHRSIRKFPMADGGEGTLEIFLHHTKGKLHEVTVHDPLMRRIKSCYAISQDGETAFIEMARASGLGLLKSEERNPLLTTTYGTGELIKHALQQKVKQIIIGIGGSATNDAAMGALCALGGKLLDEQRKELTPCGENLAKVYHIELDGLDQRLKDVQLTALCDVTNLFYGVSGAAFIYAPQKGADHQAVERLDQGLKNISQLISKQREIDLQSIPGTGAGGGFAGGALALLGAELKSGTAVVFSMTHFEKAVSWAEVIITGEGKIDQQTLTGKVIHGVVQLALQQKKKVIAVCGQTNLSADELEKFGLGAVYSLTEFTGMEKAMQQTAYALEELLATKIATHLMD